jgi:hypothetical protein
MEALLKLVVAHMAQHDVDLKAVQMRLIVSVGIFDEALKQVMLDVSTEWNATSSSVRRTMWDTASPVGHPPSGHHCGYTFQSCLFYMLVTMLKEEAVRQQAFDVVPQLQRLADRDDQDLLLFRVKYFSGHPKPMRGRCWRFNITPSLDCPAEVVHTLIQLVSALDSSDAKIKVLPAALNTYRFIENLQQDWKSKTGKPVMPHLEMCNDVNAWDALMQEAARDYDSSRTLPNVPEARADHARRVAGLPEALGQSLKVARRPLKEDREDKDKEDTEDTVDSLRCWANEYPPGTDGFDLKCWASEYAPVAPSSVPPGERRGKGWPDWIPAFSHEL